MSTEITNNLIYLENYPEMVDLNKEYGDMYWGGLEAPIPSDSKNPLMDTSTVLCLNQKHFKKFVKLTGYNINWHTCNSKERFPSKYPCIVQLYRHFEGGMIYTSIEYNIPDKYLKKDKQ